MKVDINNKYCTRDECEVIIYAIYHGQDYPVHGAIFENDEWIPQTWTLNGRISRMHASTLDLVEVKPERVVWINEYAGGFGDVHRHKEAADRSAVSARIALHRVVLNENTVWKGEGDE